MFKIKKNISKNFIEIVRDPSSLRVCNKLVFVTQIITNVKFISKPEPKYMGFQIKTCLNTQLSQIE